jgi:hypothetical protein
MSLALLSSYLYSSRFAEFPRLCCVLCLFLARDLDASWRAVFQVFVPFVDIPMGVCISSTWLSWLLESHRDVEDGHVHCTGDVQVEFQGSRPDCEAFALGIAAKAVWGSQVVFCVEYSLPSSK